MYLPDPFRVDDRDALFAFIDAHAFGQLISTHDGRPMASHLPFLVGDDRQRLRCHLARPNPQWRDLDGQQALVTFLGPHDYVSPGWYQTPGVPTWNYQAVHVYGACRVFDGHAELAALVEALAARYEASMPAPWQPRYRDAMLAAIVGVELEIVEVQGKYKLSQNRPAADHRPVIEQLERRGSTALARAMRDALS